MTTYIKKVKAVQPANYLTPDGFLEALSLFETDVSDTTVDFDVVGSECAMVFTTFLIRYKTFEPSGIRNNPCLSLSVDSQDWVVELSKGHLALISDEEFLKHYQKAEGESQ